MNSHTVDECLERDAEPLTGLEEGLPIQRRQRLYHLKRADSRFSGSPVDAVAFQVAKLPFGAIKVLPFPLGEKATVEVRPARGFDIGAGKSKGTTFNVDGGEVGLIIDARGRPIAIPSDDSARAGKMREWLQAMGLSVGG